jgi:hypothetical protein
LRLLAMKDCIHLSGSEIVKLQQYAPQLDTLVILAFERVLTLEQQETLKPPSLILPHLEKFVYAAAVRPCLGESSTSMSAAGASAPSPPSSIEASNGASTSVAHAGEVIRMMSIRHHHPLLLTTDPYPKYRSGIFMCDICRQPGGYDEVVWHCTLCWWDAHLLCLKPVFLESKRAI